MLILPSFYAYHGLTNAPLNEKTAVVSGAKVKKRSKGEQSYVKENMAKNVKHDPCSDHGTQLGSLRTACKQ